MPRSWKATRSTRSAPKDAPPYAHIITDNFKSISLQKKLGANVADDLVIWMSRSDREKK